MPPPLPAIPPPMITIETTPADLTLSGLRIVDHVFGELGFDEPLEWKIGIGARYEVFKSGTIAGPAPDTSPLPQDTMMFCGVTGKVQPRPFPLNRMELYCRSRLVGRLDILGGDIRP